MTTHGTCSRQTIRLEARGVLRGPFSESFSQLNSRAAAHVRAADAAPLGAASTAGPSPSFIHSFARIHLAALQQRTRVPQTPHLWGQPIQQALLFPSAKQLRRVVVQPAARGGPNRDWAGRQRPAACATAPGVYVCVCVREPPGGGPRLKPARAPTGAGWAPSTRLAPLKRSLPPPRTGRSPAAQRGLRGCATQSGSAPPGCPSPAPVRQR